MKIECPACFWSESYASVTAEYPHRCPECGEPTQSAREPKNVTETRSDKV